MKTSTTKRFGLVIAISMVALVGGANVREVVAAGASRISVLKVIADAFPEVTLDRCSTGSGFRSRVSSPLISR
jgi:hypothetical protein